MEKTINILGNTQREQWHSVVNMLRQLGGDMTREGRSAICDEIDRYIDFCEDHFDAERTEQPQDEPQENSEKKMTVRDLIAQEIDIDVYDDVCEELGIAFCGPLKLTEQGEEKFREVLDYEIKTDASGDYATAAVCIDGDGWKKKLRKAKEFFYAAAGYCADSDYNTWFEQEA